MKYGLRKDIAFTQKEDYLWKSFVENEIERLQKQMEELLAKTQCLANKHQCSLCTFDGRAEWTLPVGTRFVKPRITCEDSTFSKHLCINMMPEYSSWSLEELRLADYSIGNLQHYFQFGTTWPCSENTISGSADMKERQANLQPFFSEHSSTLSCVNQPEIEFKVDELRVVNKYEELMEKVVLELNNVNKNITSVNSRLFAVENNLSEISLQVSVLDSKLNTVDMLVTMENLEKKWKILKPRLISLENTPARSIVEPSYGEEEANKSLNETFKSDEINKSLPVISSTSMGSVLSVKANKPPPNVKTVKSCHSSSDLNCSSPMHLIDYSENISELSDYQSEMDISASAQSTLSSFNQNILESSTLINSVPDFERKYLTPKTKSNSLEFNEQNINSTLTDKNNTKKCNNTSDPNSSVSSYKKTENNDPEMSNNSMDLLEINKNFNKISHFEDSLKLSVAKVYRDYSGKNKSCDMDKCNDETLISMTVSTTNFPDNVHYSNENKDGKTVISSQTESSNICDSKNVVLDEKDDYATIESDYVIVQTKAAKNLVKIIEEKNVIESTTNTPKTLQNLNEIIDCTTFIPSDDTYVENKISKIGENENEPDNVTQEKQKYSNIVNDYLIVQTGEIISSPGPSSSSMINEDFPVCPNLTEYLEVNLGKNKDECYKFTFKPQTTEGSSSPKTKSNSLEFNEENINSTLTDKNNTKKCNNTSDPNSSVSSSNTTENNDPEMSNNTIDLLGINNNFNKISHFEDSLKLSVAQFCRDYSGKNKSCDMDKCNDETLISMTLSTTNYPDNVHNSNEKKDGKTVISSQTESSNICDSKNVVPDEKDDYATIESDYVIVQTKDAENFIQIIEEKNSLESTTNTPKKLQNLNEIIDCTTFIPSDDTYVENTISKIGENENEPDNFTQEKQNYSNIVNEYVTVQTGERISSPGPSSSSMINEDFPVCTNLTEYLEVNLGKNKDECYKFTFKPQTAEGSSYPTSSPFSNSIENERDLGNNKDVTYKFTFPVSPKATYPIFSPLSICESELKISLSIKDDCFETFLSDFTKKNSHENKQSSPLVNIENTCENLEGCQVKNQKSGVHESKLV